MAGRELATVETASILGQLSAIEILARHRELCGYATLDELERVLGICMQRPSACHVVLNGPDTLLISQFEPAIDFLVREVGFAVKKETIGGGAAPAGSGGGLNTSGATARGASSVASSRRAPREILSLVMPRPAGWVEGMPEPTVSEDSADWQMFKAKLVKGVELVKWARWANTSLLTVKLSDVFWYRPPTSKYGFEVRLSWKNVLGREKGELFSVGDRKYTGAHPSVLEVCDSKCDGPCSIGVYVYRDRMLIMPKLVGKAKLEFDNRGIVTQTLDIIDPALEDNAVADPDTPQAAGSNDSSSAPGGGGERPAHIRGVVQVEVSSIRNRYTQMQEELAKELSEKRAGEQRARLEAMARAAQERAEENRRLREEQERMLRESPPPPPTAATAASSRTADVDVVRPEQRHDGSAALSSSGDHGTCSSGGPPTPRDSPRDVLMARQHTAPPPSGEPRDMAAEDTKNDADAAAAGDPSSAPQTPLAGRQSPPVAADVSPAAAPDSPGMSPITPAGGNDGVFTAADVRRALADDGGAVQEHYSHHRRRRADSDSD